MSVEKNKSEKSVTSATINDAAPQVAFRIRGVRVAEGLARFAGDAGRYRHWLEEFVSEGPEGAVAIRRAIELGALDTGRSLTHALKGRAGMLGIAEVHLVAQLLEAALRDGEPTLLWLDELEESVAEVCAAIEETVKTLSDAGGGAGAGRPCSARNVSDNCSEGMK